jgi:hypothetical protein
MGTVLKILDTTTCAAAAATTTTTYLLYPMPSELMKDKSKNESGIMNMFLVSYY